MSEIYELVSASYELVSVYEFVSACYEIVSECGLDSGVCKTNKTGRQCACKKQEQKPTNKSKNQK